MKNPNPDTIVRRFIDGELPQEEVQEALHHIADDPEARALLQFELRMTQDLAASRSPDPSAEFAARTAQRAATAETGDAQLPDRIRDWWRAVTQPLVTIPVRPAHTLAVLAVIVAVSWLVSPSVPSAPLPNGSAPPERTPAVETAAASADQGTETVWSRFVYTANDADSVAVAGDFSNWEPIPLSPRTVDGETVWTGLVPVPRGEHEYQFVINGEKWVTDPLAPVKQDDGFGAKNAVLKL